MRTTTIRPTSDGRYLVFETVTALRVLTFDEGVAYLEQTRGMISVATERGMDLVLDTEREAEREIVTALENAAANARRQEKR